MDSDQKKICWLSNLKRNLKDIWKKGHNSFKKSHFKKYYCFRTFPGAKSNFVPKGVPIGFYPQNPFPKGPIFEVIANREEFS